MKLTNVRNFCIIAHIDHGKSTLADRLIELTKTVDPRLMKNQILDQMDLEREKGITIKLQPIRMEWQGHILNLIDTPGHVDFNYEVSRSLAAVEGALLIVDATQGIQAQTLSNLYLALEQNLTIIPVINKIDLPAADIEATQREIVKLVGCHPEDIIQISAKTGQNIDVLLNTVITKVPAPEVADQNLRALIFDAVYNEYKGIVIYTRLFSGLLKVGDQIKFISNQIASEVIEVGYFKPQWTVSTNLTAGDIGYIVTNIKDIEQARVGDTIALASDKDVPAWPGYKEVQPMVYAGIYPQEGNEYSKFRDALYKLKLSDSSLVFEPENSPVLGFGFRCGFLGLLHLEIFQQRLLREYNMATIITSPSVAYHVTLSNSEQIIITSPSLLPDPSKIEKIEEPIVLVDLLSPKSYMGPLMNYLADSGGILRDTEFIDEKRVLLKYRLPLTEILTDFYDKIKNISSGYASYNYELVGYEPCDVIKLEILVADEVVPSLTSLAYRDKAYAVGKAIVNTLKHIIPRKQFEIKIQAAIGGKIIAAERISAMRKDVTAKLYGGDVTRKRKLLEKQKKGKKKMLAHGKVEIPQEAFLAVLKRG